MFALIVLVIALLAPAPPAVPATTRTFHLCDYGAKGNGVADDGPALQRALQAVAAAGGGALMVPAGRYAILTPVHGHFAGLGSAVTIQGVPSSTPVPPPDADKDQMTRGLDLVSELLPRTGPYLNAVSVDGLRGLLIRDIAFVGTPDVETDALVTLAIDRVEDAIVRHCEFYGLSTRLGGAVVRAEQSRLTIEGSAFLGSTANSGVYAPVVENLDWKGITIAETAFVDYGQRSELYGKMGLGSPLSWINIGNAAAVTSDSPRREVVIRKVFLDEGGYLGISSHSIGSQPPSAPIDLVYVTGLRMNVSNLSSTGHSFDQVQRVLVEDSHYGWSHNTVAAIDLLRVGEAILSRLSCIDGMTCVRASGATGKITVINSRYSRLDSPAQTINVLRSAGAQDDPVLYVRQQFAKVLGRDPDAAAHLYWSKQILDCGSEASCAAQRRTELAAYLASSPRPTFSITGLVKDEHGAALRGLPVTLSGSQSVATFTGRNGRYRFAGLPTSGVYTVTASKQGSVFAPQAFTTPRGDCVADFAARP